MAKLQIHSAEVLIRREGQSCLFVQKFRVCGTNRWVYQAWEQIEGPFDTNFSTITVFNQMWFGRIGTGIDVDKFKHLKPYTEERSVAVGNEYQRVFKEAYAIILEAFPMLKDDPNKQFDGGEITTEEVGEIEIG